MDYKIVIGPTSYLMHHGVKGMKWGVRKVDYNSSGLKSSNIYDRLDSLERQESDAYSANSANRRSAIKSVKTDAKASVKAAKAANKEARKAYNQSFNKAYGFSQKHAITTMIKKHDNYKKNQENWADAIKKADAAKAAKQNLKETKKAAKADVKSGKAAANAIWRKNNATIEKNFDKAYYKTIGEKHIKSARKENAVLEIASIMTDKAIGIDHDDSSYQDRKRQLDRAAERRQRYIDNN